MTDAPDPPMAVETKAGPADVRVLDDGLSAFGFEATGIHDGKLLCVFLRGPDGAAVGGVYGWTWGGACYIRYLYLPEDMRGRGLGTRLMSTIEAEARARGCRLIVLETHSYQAPDFYRRFGFVETGRVDGYPLGHSYLTMVKQLDGPAE
jgi:GNAT superfamily N-acetyltransferase